MKEGVEKNIVTQAEREATMRTLGHSATTVNRYYLPHDRYNLALVIYILILIHSLSHNRLAYARTATAAFDTLMGEDDMGSQEAEEMESEDEEANIESEEEAEGEVDDEDEEEDAEGEDEEEEEGGDDDDEAQHQGMEEEEEGSRMEEVEEEEVKEYEWEEAEAEVEAQQLQQVWGKLHPDKRSPTDGLDIRVPWSEAERDYVRKWIIANPDVPVRLLYEDVHACGVARDIFHAHHVELDKISYMFKLLRKTVL